jgi:hypothetical protein
MPINYEQDDIQPWWRITSGVTGPFGILSVAGWWWPPESQPVCLVWSPAGYGGASCYWQCDIYSARGNPAA